MLIILDNIHNVPYIDQSVFEANGSSWIVDCRGAVASVRDSYTGNPSLIPVRLIVTSW